MKIINTFFIMILIALSSCQVSTLTDETANKFIITASQGLDDHVEIEWIKTEYYANFAILRSSSEHGTYTPITHRIDTSKYLDKTIEAGAIYYYKVQGYNDIGTAMYLTDSAKGYAGAGGGFLPPKNVRINAGQSSSFLKLEWDGAEGATYYKIERSENNIDFDEIAKTPISHYEDEDVLAGKTYYYQITSFQKVEDKFYPSQPSLVVTGSVFGTDLGLSTTAGAYSDQIVLTWKKYEYATIYVLFRSEIEGNVGEIVKIVNKSEAMEYIDTDVEKNKLYYYYITYQNDSGSLDQSETVRSYLQADSAPAKPTDFTASQGLYPNDVELSWTAVDGASSYEIARSTSETGPWKIIETTATDSGVTVHKDRVPNDSYTYFYTITGLNPAPGTVSDIKEGWANKAPLNITASDSFGEKVVITWDKVPGAMSYSVSFSDTELGEYTIIGSPSLTDESRISFDHIFNIESESKDLFYKVQVTTAGGSSLPSLPILGTIKKIGAPQNIEVLKNRTATKDMMIAWDEVPNAKSYNIYRAILSHKNSDPNKLEIEHFTHIVNVVSPTYNLSFNTYPIRRYVYMVKAVDGAGAEGVNIKTDLVWRLPVDLEDFAKDVDFSIVQAQTQIPNFGGQGSGGNVKGRAGGQYQYYAGLSGSKNNWLNYSSFEIILHGNNPVSVDIWSMSASLSGTAIISGLYSGKVTYNNLAAKDGGFVTGGGMTFEYNHPTKGLITETWNHTKADGILDSVFVNSSGKPGRPSFEAGHG